MTNPYDPTTTGPTPPPPPPPVPTPQAPAGRPWFKRKLVWAGGVVLVLAIAGAASGSADKADDDSSTTGSPAGAPAAEAPDTAPTTERPTTTTAPPAPAVTDYSIALITQTSQCFGSAGCNVQVVPELTILGPAALGQAADITYTIDGDDSGPIIQTISVDAAGNYGQRTIFMSTASQSVVPTATITAVR